MSARNCPCIEAVTPTSVPSAGLNSGPLTKSSPFSSDPLNATVSVTTSAHAGAAMEITNATADIDKHFMKRAPGFKRCTLPYILISVDAVMFRSRYYMVCPWTTD